MVYSDISYEKELWKRGFEVVIGVDEVGRGAVAGPVIAAAAAIKNIILNIKNKKDNEKLLQEIMKLGIDDSKKLSPQKREKLDKGIKKYFYIGIGHATVGEINRLGIVKATERAMRRAISKIKDQRLNLPGLPAGRPGGEARIKNTNQKSNIFVVIDAFYVKYIPGVELKNQEGIVHGDGLSISIAAASIVAKVYRDGLMKSLSNKYKQYGWDKNKGYGTEHHRRAIKVCGISRHHRRDFVEGWK